LPHPRTAMWDVRSKGGGQGWGPGHPLAAASAVVQADRDKWRSQIDRLRYDQGGEFSNVIEPSSATRSSSLIIGERASQSPRRSRSQGHDLPDRHIPR
jgi:hypothetical protein